MVNFITVTKHNLMIFNIVVVIFARLLAIVCVNKPCDCPASCVGSASVMSPNEEVLQQENFKFRSRDLNLSYVSTESLYSVI